MKETGLTFRPALPPWGMVLLAAALVLLALWAYRRTTRPVRPRLKALLVALRLAAAGALLVCLLRPAVETTTYTVEKQPLVFLTDESRSMTEIQDTARGSSRLEAIRDAMRSSEDAFEKLRERYDVRMLSFAREVLTGESRAEFATSYSAYGRALEDALKSVPLGQCDGIVLLGDGSHNLGPPDPLDVAAALADRGIPLYTVGVGREEAGEGLRDVEIVALEAPRKAHVFSTFTVRGRILFRGCRGLRVKVRLELPDHGVQFQTVAVAHDEELVPVQFQLTAETLGEFKITMRAQDQPEEILLDNNVRSAFVRVVSSGLRVAYFDSLRPEAKFVTRALRGAKQINVLPAVVSAQSKPSERETDWERYDVIVLGDIPPTTFTGDNLRALRRAAQEQGKGLVLLAGARSAGNGGFGGTFLADVLPAEFRASSRYVSGERVCEVAAGAAEHPVLALGQNPAESLKRWKQMPPLTGVIVGPRPKRGAEVLLRDQEGNPLLCTHRAGAGRAACVLTDTTFRWFFTESDTQEQHHLFWRQLVLWAGGMDEKPEEEFWITLTKSQVGVGEPVGIQAHLSEPGGEPIRDAKVRLKVQTPGGQSADLESLYARGQGCFEAEYAPPAAGQYVVRAEALRAGKPVGADAAFFQAFSTDLELEDPVANLSLLRRLAAATRKEGGQYRLYGNLHRLLEDLAGKGEPLRLTTTEWRDVWDSPVLFALFVLAMAAEWGLRRWKGLV